MSSQKTEKQPISLGFVAIAGVLAFFSMKLAAGFTLWPSVVAALVVAGAALAVRHKMLSKY